MAKWTEYIANWFRPSESDENEYYDDEPEAAQTSSPANETISQNNYSEKTAKPQAGISAGTEKRYDSGTSDNSNAEVAIPYWIEDEDALRDEGVLFGLSESDPEEKTDIIHRYFSNLTAGCIAEIEQHNEQIQELNLFIGQKNNRIEELNDKLKNPPVQFEREHQLPRTLIGISLCVAMCIGNFFLIRESLKPAFADNSWIALGVFLAGMFSLFGRISLFHDAESRISWKSLLEETGLPFAAALFVFANVVSYQSWWQAFALFVFVFFLFLFAGKLLLSNITVLRNDLQAWLRVQQERKDAIDNSENWESECQTLQQEIDELRVKKWQVLREQSAAETERDRLYAKRDMLIKLFESEFFLARRMKNELTGKQLNMIRKGGS
ncbi:hypothetical protein [Dyadobacter sediminis]|uniref:Uncharacterized protein n=1 Tax=Dyadobacter sediminis TaxID=1493691 RepID=A0A5R9KD96_9BACT|nr:hypothetical protein [Dyadobacter sediminis]TLU94099.1 hypothetical protein FEM55_07500 [Dyadobacter sediminis]GGB94250.1 hypothetical protein GCM10011325_22090 [Dyadobacter sediminis]